MRAIALGVLLLGLVSCVPNTHEDDKRWSRLNGDRVLLASGYEQVVHVREDCPKLTTAKVNVIPCKVKGTRLIDENGIYQNPPEQRLSLCGSCVR